MAQTQIRGLSKKVAVYNKLKLGFAGKQGLSMYDITSLSLAKDGKIKPKNTKNKDWVLQNIEFIKESILSTGYKSSAKQKTNKDIVFELKKSKYSRVISDSFLSSYDWRKLRMEALKKYGSKCQCCGATPATGAVMNVDHIKPRKFFPELALSLSNLQVLCHECNHGKGNWDQTDWRNPDR
jgi:hypothetical protein